MWYVLVFCAGFVAAALANWLWESITKQRHGGIVQELDEFKAAQENEELIRALVKEGLPEMTRSEIWNRMSWLWKETRGWALRSRQPLSLLCLACYAVLYTGLWVKTLLFPDSHDLRLLVGGRSVLMYVAQKKK